MDALQDKPQSPIQIRAGNVSATTPLTLHCIISLWAASFGIAGPEAKLNLHATITNHLQSRHRSYSNTTILWWMAPSSYNLNGVLTEPGGPRTRFRPIILRVTFIRVQVPSTFFSVRLDWTPSQCGICRLPSSLVSLAMQVAKYHNFQPRNIQHAEDDFNENFRRMLDVSTTQCSLWHTATEMFTL